MKHILVFALLSLLSIVASAQTQTGTTCETLSNNGDVNLKDVSMQGTAEHSSGSHQASTGVIGAPLGTGHIVGTCTYTTGSGSLCNTACHVTTNSPGSTSETGSLSQVAIHNVSTSWADGSGGAAGAGASCMAKFAGGAVSCLGISSTCVISLSFSGGGLQVNASGTVIWQQEQDIPFSCAAIGDPTKGNGGTQNCTANPNSLTLGPGPTGFFIVQDPAPTPDPACTVSPIIIDLSGKGFFLTDAAGGVKFDMLANGHPIQLSWTAPGAQNAFLVLPASDGLVHSSRELFGDYTPQPKSAHPNGFIALAEYDKPENGGVSDGVIDARDAVFSRLRLWLDDNHDGVSQPEEIHTLDEFGVFSLSLRYFESRRQDQFGNQFRYKARLNPDPLHRDPRDETPSGEPGRWIYDVFLIVGN